jgi:iron complex outermembrane receptor protein
MAGQIVSRSRRSAPPRHGRRNLAFGASVGALASALLWSPAAQAQAPGSQSPTQLEEVVVTAQRRSESAQTVPIAVAVISSESAQAAGAVDTNSLSGKVPALVAVP